MNEPPVSDLQTPQTWAHCGRCRAPMPSNYAGACPECRRDLRQRAESYGGDSLEVETRYARYRREWGD